MKCSNCGCELPDDVKYCTRCGWKVQTGNPEKWYDDPLKKNFVTEENIISYAGCMSHLYFFLVFVVAECYMLTVMAYDCYVAICSPLLYNIIMSHWFCSLLVVGVYAMELIGSTIETGLMLKLSYCEILISYYFCDVFSLMKLSCSSTCDIEITTFFLSGFNIIPTSLTVFVSYASSSPASSTSPPQKEGPKPSARAAPILQLWDYFMGVLRSCT